MPGKDWKHVKQIFQEALRHPTSERERFLDKACAGNIDLRIEVESLLISLNEAKSFLETPALGETAAAANRAWRLDIGRTISHYKIVSPIGMGGMGEVYLAEDQNLQREVALKVLSEDVLTERERLRRFQREAHAVSALNHPNILTIFEFGEDDGVQLIASEYVKGETLRDRMSRGRLEMLESLEIAAQVASALEAAHEAGIVHRDVKPENIMIRGDGWVKVLDFGLAKLTRPRPTSDTQVTQVQLFSQPGMIMGTATYMSPEQARGTPIDARTDLFSLGVVLYEMLSGRPPFTGETNTDVIAGILQLEPAPLTTVNEKVTAEIDSVVMKALKKDRVERYQAAHELLADLKALVKRLEFESESSSASPAAGRAATAAGVPEMRYAYNDSLLSTGVTPIIGREKEIGEVVALVKLPGIRLVTLTGIGGTGKTRLAQAAIARLKNAFRDGSVFIELSCIDDPSFVVSAIAQAVGVPEGGENPLLVTLREFLHDKEILLTLDNFEQVVAARSYLAELLNVAPKLKLLVTSRERLNISSETEYPVPPLPLPPSLELSTVDELREIDSIRLFELRARAGNTDFEISDDNISAVAEICARLDGLPLAIELAAARTRLLSPAAILARLDDRLTLLTGGAKDLPARQQTMRNAIEWSYDLLDEAERRLFRRLSVFAGEFTPSVAEAVTAETSSIIPADNGGPGIEFLDLLASLADKSLVVRRGELDGERRFGLLETVREYAAAALEAASGADAIRLRHAEHYLALAESAEPHLKGAESARWLHLLEEEHANIGAALKWSLHKRPEMAARLAAAIRHLWTIHGHLNEGRRWAEAILSLDLAMPPDVRWKILTVYGNIAQFQGDLEKAGQLYEESLAVSRASGSPPQIAQALRGLGALAYMERDFAAARELIEEATVISRKSGDRFGLGASLARLGDIANAEGDLAASYSLSSEALEIYREIGYKEGISAKLNNLGAVSFLQGKLQESAEYFREALDVAIELGEKINTRLIFDGLAALAAKRGEYERSARLSGVADSLEASVGYAVEPAEERFRESYLADLRSAMSQDKFESEREKGRRLTLEQATVLADLTKQTSATARTGGQDGSISAPWSADRPTSGMSAPTDSHAAARLPLIDRRRFMLIVVMAAAALAAAAGLLWYFGTGSA